MFGPLSIFEKDVLGRNELDLLAREGRQEAGSLARVETIRVLLFLIGNGIRMDN
jgi:hypothetical protein